MRWTRNDTEAYNVVSTAGKGLLTAMERARLGEAYRNGTEVTGPQSEDMIKAYQQEEGLQRRAIDENNAYTPGTAEGAAAEAQNAQAARVAGLYGQAATDNSKYRVGSQMYDTAPTGLQKHRGGLERQMEYLASRGDAEEAAKLQERISGLDTAEMQRKQLQGAIDMQPLQRRAIEQQLKIGDYTVSKAASEDAARNRVMTLLQDKWKNPVEALKSEFNMDYGRFGEGNSAGKKLNAVPMPDGSGDHLVWETDAKGGLKGEAKLMSADQIRGEAQRSMLADLAIADPEKYLDKAIAAGHSAAQLKEVARQHTETIRHNMKIEDLTAEQRKNEDKKLDLMLKEVTAKIDMYGREKAGQPITMADKDGNPVVMVPVMGKNGLEFKKAPGLEGLSFTAKSGGKPARAFPAEVDKAATEQYVSLNLKDGKAVGEFDARFPGWRESAFGSDAGGLKIRGNGEQAPPGAPAGGQAARSVGLASVSTARAPYSPRTAGDPRVGESGLSRAATAIVNTVEQLGINEQQHRKRVLAERRDLGILTPVEEREAAQLGLIE